MTTTQGPPTIWTTPTQFSQDVLAALNIPANPVNIGYLNAWQGAEGQWGATGQYNSTAQHNPLNTTLKTAGSTDLVQTQTAGVWVQSYPDAISGLDATVATLKDRRYAKILSILKGTNAGGGQGQTAEPNSPADFAQAVGASGWGTDPNALLTQWNKGDPGAAYSGSGIIGTATLGALGPGSTGPSPRALWKVGPFTILDTTSGGTLVMVGGGLVMLIGTIVILFRFKPTQAITEAVVGGTAVGRVARVASGRGPGPRRASRRSGGRTEEQQAAGRERKSRSGQEAEANEAYRAGVARGRASASAPPFPDE